MQAGNARLLKRLSARENSFLDEPQRRAIKKQAAPFHANGL